MKLKVLSTVGIIICAVCCGAALAMSDEGTIIDWGDKPTVGTIIKNGPRTEYLVTMKFGVEGHVLGETATVTNPIHSVLDLLCSSAGTDGKPWCIVKWVDVDCLMDPGSPCDPVDENSTFEENLDLTRTDWERGELNIELLEPDKTKTHVYVRLKYEDSLILLQSFRAYSDARHVLKEPLPPIKWEIPSYTYSLRAPVKLRGMLSEGQKQWNDLIETLSNQDQATWQAIKSDPKRRPSFGRDTKQFLERLKKDIPDIERVEQGKREPTPAENKVLDNVVAEEATRKLSEWFANSGFSTEGQKKVTDFLSKKIPRQATNNANK